MAGHLFVLRGDVRQLACDAWLMPCGPELRNARFLPADLRTTFDAWPEPPPGWGQEGGPRVVPIDRWPRDRSPEEPQPWMIDVGGTPDVPLDWYVAGLREALARVLPTLAGKPAKFRRCRPLLALPLLGTGWGNLRETGEAARAFLAELLAAAAQRDVDLALVTLGPVAFAAVQQARRRHDGPQVWQELHPRLRRLVDAWGLADLASGGRLALFLGGGVSVGAGLPTWAELLGELARRGGLSEAQQERLGHVGFLEQASFLERRLGGTAALQNAVCEILTHRRHHYSLQQGLLAGLPVREVVTTNYDQLFERAWDAATADWDPARGAPGPPQLTCSIIPHALHPAADRWLLKMHGSVADPSTIVLTRETYVRYSHQWAALEGILQATLLTRHMLFVGFSMTDENFLRIVDAVRRLVQPEGAEKPAGPFATTLALGDDPVLRELWQGDMRWLACLTGEEATADPQARARAARQLEILLDYLLAQTNDPAYLLDDRCADILTASERLLRDRLAGLAALLPPPDHRGPAWEAVADLLHRFGWKPPARVGT